MGVLDFLFQGSPPPSTTTYGKTVTNIPQFMTDYTLGLLSKANAVAAEPYQPYGGPRVAQFSPEQQQAFQQTAASQGQFMPALQSGLNMTQQAGTADITGASQPYMSAASMYAPQVIGSYMSPYTSSVVDRIGQLAGRNLAENFMPNINANFIRAGQFGSRGQQEAIGQTLRDLQESTLAEQNKALQAGYGAATTAAQTDLARQAQLAQLAGNQAQMQSQAQLQAGQQMGTLGQLGQTMNLKDLAALEAVGGTQQQQVQKNLDTAYQDFLAQRKYPQDQLAMLNSLIRGLPYSTSTQTSSTGPASTYQPSPLAQLAGAFSLYNAFQKAEGGYIKRNPNRRSSRGRKRR